MTASIDKVSNVPNPRRRTARGVSEWSERNFKWLLVVPAILLILALSVYPLLFSIWVSFVIGTGVPY